MTEKILAWEQQPGESDYFFKLFEDYLSLSKRSYSNIAKRYNLSKRTIVTYAKKWNWYQRALLRDQFFRDNVKYNVVDYCKKMSNEKSRLKLSFAVAALDIVDNMRNYLENADKIHKIQDVRDQMKFYREVMQTFKQLAKCSDFALDGELLNAALAPGVNLDKFLKTDVNVESQYVLNDNKSINVFLDKKPNFTDSKNEKIGAIGAIGEGETDEFVNEVDEIDIDNRYPTSPYIIEDNLE